MNHRFVIDACRDREQAAILGHFFAANVSGEYVSHGEIQFGRADLEGAFFPNLAEIVAQEIRDRFDDPFMVLVATEAERVVAIALISWTTNPAPIATLEDLVVDLELRGQGVGAAMLTAVERAALERGAKRLYLESGIENHTAHRFFGQHGFRKTSVTFSKSLV